MNNAPAILKSLIIFAVIVPLAVIVGYMVTDPLDYSTFAYAGIVASVLVFPLLLRWHYYLLLFSFNAAVYLFFMKGNPQMWVVMVALSLGISLLERTLNSQMHFIHVPQITRPLICMIGVVFMTAKLTGGFGFRSFGSDVGGGQKYVWLIVSILSYFALTAHRIPPERANWYLGLFLLSGLTGAIGDLYPITPSFLHFIFWMFPPGAIDPAHQFELGVTRLGGIAGAAATVVFWLAARYGLRGIFLSGKLWRPVLFIMASMMIFLGGFRIKILSYLFTLGLMFFLEGLHRTRALLVFAIMGMLGMVLIIPLASHLPFTFQRSLAFLPLNISQEARQAAEGSSDWRVDMWKALLPQASQHLLLGKGYALSAEDFQLLGRDVAFHSVDASQQGLAIAGDYHNGPLSVVIPFGIWGAIVFLWFTIAGIRVMYCNYRYGDESLRTINMYMWATYLYVFIRFFIIYGTLTGDMTFFASMIGLSIALNGGVCRPAPRSAPAKEPLTLTRPFPRPRAAFQR
jgi:hypothetical protein